MEELVKTPTPEQQKALALARARLRLQQEAASREQPAPDMAPPGGQFPIQLRQEPPKGVPSIMDLVTSPNLAGGPTAMVGREGMRVMDEGIQKGAYNAGGAATDLATKMGASPEVAGGAGMATNMGVQAIPTVAGALAGKLVEPATKPVARTLYQSALKPSAKDLASGDASKAIETMLKGGFPASTGGVAKMRTIVRELSKQVDDMVAAAPGSVDKATVRKEILDQLKTFRSQVNPEHDVKTILKAWDEFRRTTGGMADIPVQRAQELKRGTYKLLADKYSHLGTVGDEAGTQAQMAMARGLRKGVEQNVPKVVEPNKKMAELINAIEIAERRSGIAGNRDLAGIAWLAENPLASAGMLADRSPYVKSTLARLLYSGMPMTGAATGTVGHALLAEPEERERREAFIRSLKERNR